MRIGLYVEAKLANMHQDDGDNVLRALTAQVEWGETKNKVGRSKPNGSGIYNDAD